MKKGIDEMNITQREKVGMIKNGDFLPENFKLQFKENKFINIREKSYANSIIQKQLIIEILNYEAEISEQRRKREQEYEFINGLLSFSNKLIDCSR